MKLLTLFVTLLPALAVAESLPVVIDAKSVVIPPASTATTPGAPVLLPQLSFEAQKARSANTQAEYREQQSTIEFAPNILLQAKQHLEQLSLPYLLSLSEASAKAYLLNGFKPLWQDKNVERLFLREYAAFALSGVSTKATQAVQHLLNLEEGFTRDVVLTDSFLDYLYYHRNVLNNANQWLYNSIGSYRAKAPEDMQIQLWVESVKSHTNATFLGELIPKNHIYQETLNKLFSVSLDESIELHSPTKKKENGKANSISIYKLALNAQRLRLIPSFENGIFVNIPSYQLYYFRDGELKLQSKVIVGRDDRRTPVMYSKLSNVVVNPPWNVPTSIKNKDIVPRMRKDPSYAERNGYEIIDGQGNKISAHDIPWEAYEGANFPYRLRQKAGDDSALGRYKFNMPSSDAIYLHDTPNHKLFNRSGRALSSGCVRVAKSDELATILLKEAGWSEQRKKSVLESKKTTSAHIQSDNPVYLYYVTAWVENGQVYTLPDIYSYDRKLPQTVLDWERIKQNVIVSN